MTFVSVSFCYPSGRTFAGGPNCQKSRISCCIEPRPGIDLVAIGREEAEVRSCARRRQDERGLLHPPATMRPGAQGLKREGSGNGRYD